MLAVELNFNSVRALFTVLVRCPVHTSLCTPIVEFFRNFNQKTIIQIVVHPLIQYEMFCNLIGSSDIQYQLIVHAQVLSA